MRNKLILLALAAVLLLVGCESKTPDDGNDEQTTTAPITTTATTTTASTTTIPKTDEQPSVPQTTVPPQTEEIPETNDVPVTTAPVTEDIPVTTEPSTEEESTIVLDKGSAQELSVLMSKYPIVGAPDGIFASKTLTQLIESASRSFCESSIQSVTATGSLAVSVPLLGDISKQTLELSFLTNGAEYKLSSKITESTKVTNDHQVYQNGWLYNTSTTTQLGVVTETDNYKIAMTPAEFAKNVLANTTLTMEGIQDLAKLLETATNIKVGMLSDGSCAILAKGFDFTAMMKELDPDGSITKYVDVNSFKNMEVAVVIDANDAIKDLYVKLPLSVNLEGIPTTINFELLANPFIPESVSIKVPEGGKDYVERTIEEVYGDEDDFVFDWF